MKCLEKYLKEQKNIPIDFVGNSESFMLTVRGESMIEAGILDGDYILVRKQNTAENGEIVVALIEDEATVKTFYKEKDHIRLQPENSSMSPIIVDDCKILGKVSGVFRKIQGDTLENILVVEDNSIISNSIRYFLESDGKIYT